MSQAVRQRVCDDCTGCVMPAPWIESPPTSCGWTSAPRLVWTSVSSLILPPTADGLGSAERQRRPAEQVRSAPAVAPFFHLRRCLVTQLSEADLLRWQSLASRAIDPNPFLEPEFVVPLARCIAPLDRPVTVVAVENTDSGDWHCAGVFQELEPWRTDPERRLAPVTSPFTYADHPLVDDWHGTSALRLLMQTLGNGPCRQRLELSRVRWDSPAVVSLLDSARETGAEVFLEQSWERAEFRLQELDGDGDPFMRYSASRRKSLRRARRWLEQRGAVEFRIVRPEDARHPAVERFLRLEHSGWKGAFGTSLLRSPATARFFRSIANGFATRGDLWIGELCVGESVVASSFNLRSGDTLFALKIGWDPTAAQGSPGAWSEIELATNVLRIAPDLQRLDSCSSPGSYLEALWPHRSRMASVALAWTRPSRLIGAARSQLRSLRRWFREHAPACCR